MDTDNDQTNLVAAARLDKLLQTRRAAPSALCTRLNIQVWTRDEKFVLKGRDDATAIARAAAAVRGVVGELLAPHEAFTASRVRAKEARGRVSGLYDIKLVGATRALVEGGISRLAGAGFYRLSKEDEFDDEDCFTIILPKEACVGPLIADLADLTNATRMAYETGGGLPGAGFDKARLVVNGAVEDAMKKAPKFIRADEGLITVAPVRRNGTLDHTNCSGDSLEGSLVTCRFTVMPGRTATRAGGGWVLEA